MTMCMPFLRILAIVIAVLAECISAQSFADVTSLQGLLPVWTTPSSASAFSSLPSRGCNAAYKLSTAGSLSYLALPPCNTQTDSNFPYNLTGYAPAVGMIRAGRIQTVFYSLFAPTSSNQLFMSTPTLLASIDGSDGSIVSLTPVPFSIRASALIVDPLSSLVYLITVQFETVTLYVLDSSQAT